VCHLQYKSFLKAVFAKKGKIGALEQIFKHKREKRSVFHTSEYSPTNSVRRYTTNANKPLLSRLPLSIARAFLPLSRFLFVRALSNSHYRFSSIASLICDVHSAPRMNRRVDEQVKKWIQTTQCLRLNGNQVIRRRKSQTQNALLQIITSKKHANVNTYVFK